VGYISTPTNSSTLATIWNGTGAADLVIVGGANTAGFGINNLGQAVGYVFAGGIGSYHLNATLWNGTTSTDLGAFAGYNSSANAMNDSGQVVGFSSGNATIWNGTTATILAGLGGSSSSANDINNAGQVVGNSSTGGNTAYRATIWDGTTPTDLGTLGGGNSIALGINSAGHVVGNASTSGDVASHAVLWSGGSTVDLNDFLDVAAVRDGWTLTSAVAINDKGWIVGDAYNTITGVSRGFLLSASEVPEPDTLLLTLAALGLLLATNRRRQAPQSLIR
jgi:probable HAF family extracellular repeat protein